MYVPSCSIQTTLCIVADDSVHGSFGLLASAATRRTELVASPRGRRGRSRRAGGGRCSSRTTPESWPPCPAAAGERFGAPSSLVRAWFVVAWNGREGRRAKSLLEKGEGEEVPFTSGIDKGEKRGTKPLKSNGARGKCGLSIRRSIRAN